ncbi:uncharacterized protein LOC110244993 [Exaiptasia diaphana]|uniref:Uncharacterized protein n=1 Tax=Exaiptasia diaphana TaxID=2652724 RepID=A0A913XLT8_EXADI|nr:uncharacterized protein LOC110244993 [Exaiptasia diaphana]
MSSSLVALVVLSVVLVSSCQGLSLSKINDDEKPECKNVTDKQPVDCRDTLLAMNARDKENFCNDYDLCQRTCLGCPPLEQKYEHPPADCEDEREDCYFVMRRWGQDNCKLHSAYAYRHFIM